MQPPPPPPRTPEALSAPLPAHICGSCLWLVQAGIPCLGAEPGSGQGWEVQCRRRFCYRVPLGLVLGAGPVAPSRVEEASGVVQSELGGWTGELGGPFAEQEHLVCSSGRSSGGGHMTGSREGPLVRESGAQSPRLDVTTKPVDVTRCPSRLRDAPGHSPSLDICFGARCPGDCRGDPGGTGTDMPRPSPLGSGAAVRGTRTPLEAWAPRG